MEYSYGVQFDQIDISQGRGYEAPVWLYEQDSTQDTFHVAGDGDIIHDDNDDREGVSSINRHQVAWSTNAANTVASTKEFHGRANFAGEEFEARGGDWFVVVTLRPKGIVAPSIATSTRFVA